jgi:hypothetical protein
VIAAISAVDRLDLHKPRKLLGAAWPRSCELRILPRRPANREYSDRMDDPTDTRASRGQPASGDEATSVARHIALVRQKQELRRERDQLLLDLVQGRGPDRTAEVLGVSRQDLGRLLEEARDRVAARSAEIVAEPAGEITVRRLRARHAARLASAGPNGEITSGRRDASDHRDGRTPVAGPGATRILGRRSRAERGSDRWVDADAHYVALGLRSPGDR